MNRITIYPEHVKNRISPFLLGHFAEQFRGNIPGGIYMPENPLSDTDGMRTDVIEKMKEAGVTQIRWAGNFSSHYHWMDAVGDKLLRPAKSILPGVELKIMHMVPRNLSSCAAKWVQNL